MSASAYNRYDKLYIDNEPYVWDEEEARVLPARSSFRTEHTSLKQYSGIVGFRDY